MLFHSNIKGRLIENYITIWYRGKMKNLRRWPRWLLGAIYLLAICWLVVIIRHEYIDIQTSSASNNLNGGIVFGLSLVSQEPQTLLSSLNSNQKNSEVSKGILLQSQSPTVQVYVDYISIYDNAELEKYCFTSFELKKDIDIPSRVISIQNTPTDFDTDETLGTLRDSDDQLAKYIYEFKEPFCLDRGRKHFVPHLFLGVISSNTSADLPLPKFLHFPTITGHRALEFFPFEEQRIDFNLKAYYATEQDAYRITPNLDVSVSQQGWIGVFEGAGETTTLKLSRPSFYRVILIAFTLIMAILVLFLNNIIDEVGSFFEVAFGLLLGLWGTHEILIPGYIGSSIPIDVVIYILYALVIGEIIAIFIDETIHNIAKRNIEIVFIDIKGLENEHVVIENRGWLPIDMTRWTLFDQASNKFKFPIFVLPGRISFPKKKNTTVKVWTKARPEGADAKHLKENLYWGRKQEVWDKDRDIAYLEDSKGEAIDTYSYPKRRKDDQHVKNNQDKDK